MKQIMAILEPQGGASHPKVQHKGNFHAEGHMVRT